jgi:acetyl-CoA synthetase
MTITPRLDAYRIHEHDWDSYDQLRESFEHDVPETFNMSTYVCDRWADESDRLAMVFEDTDGEAIEYTFDDLDNEASQLSNYLADQGVGQGDRVGVNIPQKPENILAHLACWKLGAVSVPLSTLFGPDAVQYRLDDSDAVACIVDADNVEALRDVRADLDALETTVTTGDLSPEETEVPWTEAIAGQDTNFETAGTDADADAIMIYTSGTTGPPKGVRHGHQVLLGYLPGIATSLFEFNIQDDDMVWAVPEWAWVGTLFGQILPSMFYGVPQVAHYADGPFDPERTFEVMDKHGVTRAFLPPTALRMMAQVDSPDERYDLTSMTTIASGGEPVGQDIVDWAAETFAGASIHEAYGQTEHNPLVVGCTKLFEFREGKMGKPVIDKEVAIVDPETAEPLDAGEEGEIAVRYEGDPSHFKQYWRKPEKTGQKRKNGWHLTEDLGVMDDDGYIAFRGRKDNVLMISGHRVGPEEIEDSLATHEAVADAGVIGIPDDTRGEVPKAYVVLADEYDPGDALTEELIQHVRDRLAKYEYPREIEYIDELPKTPTGKIQRFKLEEGSE